METNPRSGAHRPVDDLIRAIAGVAAEVVAESSGPPAFRPCMSYKEAGQALGDLSIDSVRSLVDSGVLDRPDWSTTEVRAAVVTTVSVLRASDWPIQPVAVSVGNDRSTAVESARPG